jgi:hypothetical protein
MIQEYCGSDHLYIPAIPCCRWLLTEILAEAGSQIILQVWPSGNQFAFGWGGFGSGL